MRYTGAGGFDDATVALVLLRIDSLLSSLASPTWRTSILVPFASTQKASSGRNFCSRSSVVGKKLYVGNLSYSVTSASLEGMFSPFGSVASAQVIEDRETGRSKGFGFVEMGDENAAQQAIQGMNEKEHDGRALMVNEAKPREDRAGGGGGRGRGGYSGGRY
jgi:RNA recognition motif-containing protein